jgi:hypothetical protein
MRTSVPVSGRNSWVFACFGLLKVVSQPWIGGGRPAYAAAAANVLLPASAVLVHGASAFAYYSSFYGFTRTYQLRRISNHVPDE